MFHAAIIPKSWKFKAISEISRPNCEESSAATLNSLILAFQLNNESRQTLPRNFTFPARASVRAENVHVIAAKFQPGGRAKISARAETRHVIGPLAAARTPLIRPAEEL